MAHKPATTMDFIWDNILAWYNAKGIILLRFYGNCTIQRKYIKIVDYN